MYYYDITHKPDPGIPERNTNSKEGKIYTQKLQSEIGESAFT